MHAHTVNTTLFGSRSPDLNYTLLILGTVWIIPLVPVSRVISRHCLITWRSLLTEFWCGNILPLTTNHYFNCVISLKCPPLLDSSPTKCKNVRLYIVKRNFSKNPTSLFYLRRVCFALIFTVYSRCRMPLTVLEISVLSKPNYLLLRAWIIKETREQRNSECQSHNDIQNVFQLIYHFVLVS